MLNLIMQLGQRTRLRFLSPGYLVDKFLDHIERLSGFVLPAQAATPPIATEIEARLE